MSPDNFVFKMHLDPTKQSINLSDTMICSVICKITEILPHMEYTMLNHIQMSVNNFFQ